MRLKTCIYIFLFTLLHGACLYSGQGSTSVAAVEDSSVTTIPSGGETAIRTAQGGRAVVVRINSVTIDRSNVAFPSSRPLSEGLAGVREMSVVKGIEISVDGHESFVPYSAYADLIEPDKASVAFENGEFVLTVRGGDGALSYFVRIYFDERHVYRRRAYDSLTPLEPSEDTTYWIRQPHPVDGRKTRGRPWGSDQVK